MKKITSPDYVLPHIYASAKYQTLISGANQPLLVKGFDFVNHHSGEYVLKYRGGELMNEMTSCLELLGSFMANQVEIATPEPVILHVTDDFLEVIQNEPEYENVLKGKGINFGSKYTRIKSDIVKGQVLSPLMEQQAARIFAFDLLIDNADRNDRKPNMFVANDSIFVYDHEKAFSFLQILIFAGGSKNPLMLDDLDVNFAKSHFFYPLVKGNSRIDWEEAFSTFVNLDNAFWAKAQELLPPEWNNPSDTFTRIKERADLIINSLSNFKTEIWTKIINP